MTHLFKMTPIGQALLAGGALLSVALLAFRNIGLLPLGTGDFVFFAVLAICVAAYRPGWAFLLLVMSLPLEMIDLAPAHFGIEFRPYQFLEVALVSGLLIRFLARRALPEIPRPTLPDVLLLLVPMGSLLALVNAPLPALSFKLSLVLFSLYGLYVLGRIYLRSLDDIRRVLPFILVSGAIVVGYAFFQNMRFLGGLEAFQAMPGRPDGGFPEPDWLGMYLIVLGAALLSGIAAAFSEKNPDTHGIRPRVVPASVGVLTLLFSALLMTVARSAWLGMAAATLVAIALFAYARRDAKPVGAYAGNIGAALLLSVVLVSVIPLTRFDLLGRAASTAGLQEITVSCDTGDGAPAELPERISDVSELEPYDCRHIDLEEIALEASIGNSVETVLRPDPSIGVRKDIYGTSLEEIGKHPILGIGWGSISQILGTDDRGAGLNASNVFLEVWLGSGLLGLLGLLGFLALVLTRAARPFFRLRSNGSEKTVIASEARQSISLGNKRPSDVAFPVFVLSVVSGLVVFNLFNAGVLLGFLWILFAAFLVDDKA